jgi:hypothetical protein
MGNPDTSPDQEPTSEDKAAFSGRHVAAELAATQDHENAPSAVYRGRHEKTAAPVAAPSTPASDNFRPGYQPTVDLESASAVNDQFDAMMDGLDPDRAPRPPDVAPESQTTVPTQSTSREGTPAGPDSAFRPGYEPRVDSQDPTAMHQEFANLVTDIDPEFSTLTETTPVPAGESAPPLEGRPSREQQEQHYEHNVEKAREQAYGNRMVRGNLERSRARIEQLRDKVKAAYGKDSGIKNLDQLVESDPEIEHARQREKINAEKVSRTEEAYGLLHDAVRDPAKLAHLYEMGKSRSADERALAHVALAGLKHEKRAYRAEQLNAKAAQRVARLRKDLAMANSSEMMSSLLTSGGKIPEAKRPRGWRFWQR